VAFSPGDIIDDKYRIVRLIGEGGMGYVYEGVNLRIKRRVAIKVLNADIAASADMKRRFEREAQVAAKIGSPHICDVLDLGDLPSGEAYLVMEYLEGEGFDSRIDRSVDGRLQAEELALLAYQMLEGLAAMHEAGIVHRDIKPANAFITRSVSANTTREVVKLLDFGISKFQEDEAAKNVTQTGALLGTPIYMSPEQARGERSVDHRTDIYAVGVILYRAISGRLPFEGENFQQLLFKIALEPPPPLAELAPEIDATFRGIIEKAMAKAPADRFADAREFQRALVDWVRVQGRSSIPFQKAFRSTPGAISADLVSAAAAITGARKPGLDEKSAPVAWGNPSASEMPAGLSGSQGGARAVAADAKTPPPAGSDATLVDSAALSAASPTAEISGKQLAAAAAAASPAAGVAAPRDPKRSPVAWIAAGAVIVLLASFGAYKQFAKPAGAATNVATDAIPTSVSTSGATSQPPAQPTQALPASSVAPTAPVESAAKTDPAPVASGVSAANTTQGHTARGTKTNQAGTVGAAQGSAASVTSGTGTAAANPATATPVGATPAPSADPAKTGRKIRTEL
jgi:serine/threonine-protein kinase